MRILHLVTNSLPLISGSTIRSKYIFKFQKDFARIIVLSSYLFRKSKNNLDFIEGIPYYRFNRRIALILAQLHFLQNRINDYLFHYLRIDLGDFIEDILISPFIKLYVKRLVKFYNIEIIHAHSNRQIAKYVVKLSKKYRIPFIYEVRGFHEYNLLASNSELKKFDIELFKHKYYRILKIETKLMKESDLIITLSESMKKEIIKRGIDKNKVKIVRNCTDPDILKPENFSNKLKRKLQLEGQYIMSFIGRINKYEGIEVIIKSLPFILEKFKNVSLLLIGNANKIYLNKLKNLAEDLNLSNHLLHIDAIPHTEIKKYYSISDFIVIPRLNIKLNRIVTPLKPLEAMAFKKLVIASDLPALRYSIIPKKTGDLFTSGNHKDLASKIIYYLNNPKEKRKIEEFVRKYVKENFSWKKIIPKYKNVYKDLLTVQKQKKKEIKVKNSNNFIPT